MEYVRFLQTPGAESIKASCKCLGDSPCFTEATQNDK